MAAEFTLTRRVQFAETDLAGVMHFANYFRLMEEAEHAFWRSLGHSVCSRDGDTEIGWPRVHVACDYFAPARFEDVLELTVSIRELSRTKIRFQIGFTRNGQELARGQMTAVCCAIVNAGFRPRPIPDGLRARLEAHVRAD